MIIHGGRNGKDSVHCPVKDWFTSSMIARRFPESESSVPLHTPVTSARLYHVPSFQGGIRAGISLLLLYPRDKCDIARGLFFSSLLNISRYLFTFCH